MVSLTQRYDDRIAGVLSCYDRVVVTGKLPGGRGLIVVVGVDGPTASRARIEAVSNQDRSRP